MELLKEIQINEDYEGQWRISWQMRNADNVTFVGTQFFVNGVGIGAVETTASNAYVGKVANYDVNLAAGDLIQLWGDSDLDQIFVRNFRIYYDWRLSHFGDGTILNLSTPVALSDADLLDVTNTVV
jgi:hypothetical protein